MDPSLEKFWVYHSCFKDTNASGMENNYTGSNVTLPCHSLSNIPTWRSSSTNVPSKNGSATLLLNIKQTWNRHHPPTLPDTLEIFTGKMMADSSLADPSDPQSPTPKDAWITLQFKWALMISACDTRATVLLSGY